MKWVLIGTFAVGAVWFFLKYINPEIEKADQKSAKSTESIIRRLVAQAAARHLRVSESEMLQAINKTAYLDLRTRLENELSDCRVTFTEKSLTVIIVWANKVETNLEQAITWDQIPSDIRAEIIRTGKSYIIGWELP